MLFVRIIRTICRFILFTIGSTEFIGQEHIPTEKPFLFVFNHISVFDGLLVIVGMPAMRMRLFVGPGWRRVPILAPIVGRFGGIFLEGGTERKALRDALQSIEEGAVFGLSPEGTVSKSDRLMRARDGAAYLALKAKLPILPIGIAGSESWLTNLKRLRRSHFVVRYGPAFSLPETGRRPRSKELPALSHLIMIHIAALLPERYHGAYEDSPALPALQRGDDPWPYCVAVESAEDGS